MNLLKNLVPTFCASAALWLAITAGAQTIPNPSFEADTFTVSPGYISGNGPITGWVGAPADRVGINPAGSSPFADNGVIPAGAKVAFIQSATTGPSVLSTTISGLTAGQAYTVNFRLNARGTATAALKIGIDNQPIVNITTAGVGGTAAYRFAAFNFTAASETALLSLTNDVAGDSTLLVDDFKINVSTTGWSYAQWSGDASSGVDSARTYTHAYNFGPAGLADAVINGVTFKGLGNGSPALANEFSLAGVGSVIGSDDANAPVSSGGGSASLARRFIYGGNPGTFIIGNLVPGREYVATIYSVAWETGMRAQTLSVGTDRITVNQDHYNNDQGIRISYRYIAPASGSITISQSPLLPASSLHTYGFANYEVNTPALPQVGLQPRSQVTTPGSGATFSVTATGARPLGYQWLKDGAELSGQTNRFLTVSNISALDLGGYSVVVSNANGTATSSTATLTFGNIANPSFEADVFQTFPGYASVNKPISGWNSATPTRVGVVGTDDWRNIAFGNNGVIPDGSQVGFIQGTAADWLSTKLYDLTPGQLYRLTFRVNGRAGSSAGNLKVAMDNEQLLAARVNAVGVTNAYRTVSLEFTPSTSSPTLWLTNDLVTDSAVLLDDFRVTPITETSKWTVAAWTNDLSAGVDGAKFFTHAYKFGGETTDAVVNGVIFRALPGANPSVPGQFITAGFPSVFTTVDANVLSGSAEGSAGIARNFIYNTGLQTFTLTNLQPGMQYVATIYSVAWEAPTYGRSATFVYGNDRKTLNQDTFGDNNGIRFSYPYTADASGTATFSMIPTDSASTIHTYAFANYQAVDSAPVIAAQPRDVFIGAGDTTQLSVALGAGAQPTFYQWRLGDVDLMGETNTTLVISNLTSFGTNSYTVVVSNALGVVTSAVARVEIGLRMAEVFNTGVNDSGVPIGDNETDPHYTVISSSDPSTPGPRAFAMIDLQYPIVPGTYLTNSVASKWITVNTNAIAGTFVYHTSFILDTVDPSHSQISGRWLSDNEGLDIRLNGVSLGISNMAVRPFADWSPFVISNGLVAGSNTLDFVITNQPPTGYTAFRAELYGVGRPLPPTVPQIVSQPRNLAAQELDNVEFSVVASGSGPLSYKWYYFGFELQNETNRTLRLTRVSFDQAGEYTVKVINSEGNVLSQAANLSVNSPPMANTDYIACALDTPVSVPASKLLYNDQDLDGISMSVVAVSPASTNGGTVSLSGNVVTYTPRAGYTGADQFTYTIRDDGNGTATTNVIVTVGATTFVSIVTPPVKQPGGNFQVGFQGVPGYPYTIETATSVLGPWEVLTTVVADQDGKFSVDDANPSGQMRFYRTMYP